MTQYIHKLNGQYLGFIQDQNIFQWNGEYLGWIDSRLIVWDKNGSYAGKFITKNEANYVVRNTFQLTPVSRPPRIKPFPPPTPPSPVAPVTAIQLQIGVVDSY